MIDQMFDEAAYRRTLGSFLTGVTVITTLDDRGNPRGFTANSFTSVSMNPPLILVCIAKGAQCCPVFTAANGYAVNILAEDQRNTAAVFASPESDRFSHVDWRLGPVGNPVFPDAAGWIDCRMHDLVDAGDHLILIGRAIEFLNTERPLLGFSRGSYFSAGLEHSANINGAGCSTEVIAILEQEDAVLLLTNGHGKLGLPKASRIGNDADPNSLMGHLKAAGISAELGFVFSVIDDAQTNGMRIIYRGAAMGTPAKNEEIKFYKLADIPWADLDGSATQMALERYVAERTHNRFGIYVGSENTGQITGLASA